MAALKDIRKRIVSIQNTQQITKAMKMVSASKLRKAQQDIESARPYSDAILKIVCKLSANSSDQGNNDFFHRESKEKALVLVINSDRGLCGALNNNLDKLVFKKIEELKSGYSEIELGLLGRKANDFFKRSSFLKRFSYGDRKDTEYKKIIQSEMEKIVVDFTNHKIDAVFVAFNRFKSVISQEPKFQKILPVVKPESFLIQEEENADYIYEPSIDQILEDLLQRFAVNQAYTSLLENLASEHGSRMAAMDAATNNASEVISKLKLQYNRARQATITKELIEIISGADAIS